MSQPPSRVPARRLGQAQPPPIALPPPIAQPPPVNMVQQPQIQNQNLPLQQFPNAVSPENTRPQPDPMAFFGGIQGEVTPSPIAPAPAPAQAQAQIGPQPPAPQRPQKHNPTQ